MTFGKSRDQRGAGALGCLLLLALFSAAIYAGIMLGMPRVRHSSFEDRVNESLYHLRQMPAEEMQREIIKIAGEFDIALAPAQVQIDKKPNRLNIRVTYEKPVDLKVWQTTLRFTLERSGTL